MATMQVGTIDHATLGRLREAAYADPAQQRRELVALFGLTAPATAKADFALGAHGVTCYPEGYMRSRDTLRLETRGS
jgi:hypothetical protein